MSFIKENGVFSVLTNKIYRHLLLAQVIALVGTGLATVALALALLAYDLAGDKAGQVLGIALTIKMIAYVVIGPIASAFVENLSRRTMLVCLDLIRAFAALSLPFVSEIWQIYMLIFLLQSASAAFTPTFQATIPDILSNDKDYTNALSLSRLAYDLESVISPMLAATLLTILSFHSLFAGTAVGFLISAILIITVTLPQTKPSKVKGVYDRLTKGIRIYLATPRLRGLLALNLVIAAAGAMVIVNTVILVQSNYGLTQAATALALTFFGSGSMIAALLLPSLLEKNSDRTIMLIGAVILIMGLYLGALVTSFYWLLLLWLILGIGYSLAQTPSGRLLKRSAHSEDRPAIFAAQFTLSHVCWLITYPLAGWLGALLGMSMTFAVLATIAFIAWIICLKIWPRNDAILIAHIHNNLLPDHPHLSEENRQDGIHIHEYIIDDEHQSWPNIGRSSS